VDALGLRMQSSRLRLILLDDSQLLVRFSQRKVTVSNMNGILLTITSSRDYDQHDDKVMIARANETTYDLLQMLEAKTPNGSAYLNERDLKQPHFQQVLYGFNYEPLLNIKDKYDPDQIF